MYYKEKFLYCIKIISTIKLKTSNYNIVITTSLDFAAHLQKTCHLIILCLSEFKYLQFQVSNLFVHFNICF